jgi:HNH endonuclease
MTTEIFVELKQFPGYRISNQGVLQSCRNHGKLTNDWRTLNKKPDKTGYTTIMLSCNSKKIYKRLHTLVMLAFIGPCPAGMEVCHNNGNRTDNRLANLRYDTRKHNHDDTLRHGRRPVGEQRWNSKLKKEDIPIIRAYIETGFSDIEIADIFSDRKIDRKTINAVRIGKTWKHIPSFTALAE